jgi:hypothetical protein
VISPGLALFLLAAAPTSSTPRGADAPPLLEAEAALRAGIHGKCVELARDAVKTGQLDPGPLAQAWLVRGRCHVLAGEPDKAERAYAVAVRINPDVLLPTDDDVLARLRPEGRGEQTALRLMARAVVLGEGGGVAGAVVGIDVALQDDLGLAHSVVLVDAERDREVAGAPVVVEGGPRPGLVPVHRLSGFPVMGLKARLLDKAGNRLRVVPVEVDDDVRRALAIAGAAAPGTPTQERPVTALAYVGAGVLTAGFATAAVTGIAATIALQADETRVVDDELPLVLGFGAGVIAFAVGGGLIVAERWPTTTTTDATDAVDPSGVMP